MRQPNTVLWEYMSPHQQGLIADGNILIDDRYIHPHQEVSDYSYLVFPFAKAYEGFLKQLFRDLDVITEREYTGEHFRLGKVLSPNLVKKLGGRSAYAQVSRRFGEPLAVSLWQTWKDCRNLVFHYFPHNFRRLTFDQARVLAERIIATMELAVEKSTIATRRKGVYRKHAYGK